MSFVSVQDRLLKAKREHPDARWPEVLLQRQEARALVVEVHRAAPSARK